MSLAEGNNTPTRPRIEPGSPDPESDALTTRPVPPPHRPGVVFVVVVHHFQTSYPPKPHGQSKPNFMWSLLGMGEPKFDQDGRHAHICLKHLKIFFSRTGSSMILKFGMQHWGLNIYKVCMNGDRGLTLTFFTARSNLET